MHFFSFFFFHIFILLLCYKENSISSHQTFQFQFLSFLLHFYSQKSQTLHHFVLLFSKSQNSFSKIQKNTNLHKFTQNAHFTPISFPSPQFVYLESSSHITPHHYPTHHHSPPKIIQKKSQKTHLLQKFETTLSYSTLNLILHTWWPSYSLYKYPTTQRDGAEILSSQNHYFHQKFQNLHFSMKLHHSSTKSS